jgi:hypothetical protein
MSQPVDSAKSDGLLADLFCRSSTPVNPDDVNPLSLRWFCVLKPRKLKRIEEAVSAVAFH